MGVCADAGYRKTMENFVKDTLKKTIEISERITPGWAILAKRWIVERTFAWLNHFRRQAKATFKDEVQHVVNFYEKPQAGKSI